MKMLAVNEEIAFSFPETVGAFAEASGPDRWASSSRSA